MSTLEEAQSLRQIRKHQDAEWYWINAFLKRVRETAGKVEGSRDMHPEATRGAAETLLSDAQLVLNHANRLSLLRSMEVEITKE